MMDYQDEARAIYQAGLRDLRESRKLGGGHFGLSFILPFAATAVRANVYSDGLDWLDFEKLTLEERRAVELLALPLLKITDQTVPLFEDRVDYHVRLYMLWTWTKRFAGIETPSSGARVGMMGRFPSRERKPIPRKYLRREPHGFSMRSGGLRRHLHPTAIAVDIVRMVVANGLDASGYPLPPPDGMEYEVDGD